jgi:alkanesulfonate monooxygenase SsuD/methylene tetrahydromethanopterin reductase-like flavin-dependent oxidoreductase (luciferase family)
MSAAFAHHMSPEIAVGVLQRYRQEFTPRHDGDEPYSVMSVINFASDDEEALLEFEAAWTLTMANLRRGIREPLRPEQVTLYAQSSAFLDRPRDSGRMIVGQPKVVAERLLELKEEAQADEIVAVTPSLDRARRTASLVALADAWRAAS